MKTFKLNLTFFLIKSPFSYTHNLTFFRYNSTHFLNFKCNLTFCKLKWQWCKLILLKEKRVQQALTPRYIYIYIVMINSLFLLANDCAILVWTRACLQTTSPIIKDTNPLCSSITSITKSSFYIICLNHIILPELNCNIETDICNLQLLVIFSVEFGNQG